MFLLAGKLIFSLDNPVTGLNLESEVGTADDFLSRQ